jgi:hypothetical protein
VSGAAGALVIFVLCLTQFIAYFIDRYNGKILKQYKGRNFWLDVLLSYVTILYFSDFIDAESNNGT